MQNRPPWKQKLGLMASGVNRVNVIVDYAVAENVVFMQVYVGEEFKCVLFERVDAATPESYTAIAWADVYSLR